MDCQQVSIYSAHGLLQCASGPGFTVLNTTHLYRREDRSGAFARLMASSAMVSSLSPTCMKARSCLEKQRSQHNRAQHNAVSLYRAQHKIRMLRMKTNSTAIRALDWQPSSPAPHRGSTEHAAPVPRGAAVCIHSLRQSTEHADHSPAQPIASSVQLR